MTLLRRLTLTFCFLIAFVPFTSLAQAPSDAKPTASLQKPFVVIGISVRTNTGAEAPASDDIPKLWQRFFAEGVMNRIPDRSDDAITVVYTDYASDWNGDFTYILGAKVKPGTKAPDGMVAVTVSAGNYLEFVSAKGPGAEVLPKAWMRIYGYFQESGNLPRAYKTDFERYDNVSDPNALQAHIFIGVKP